MARGLGTVNLAASTGNVESAERHFVEAHGNAENAKHAEHRRVLAVELLTFKPRQLLGQIVFVHLDSSPRYSACSAISAFKSTVSKPLATGISGLVARAARIG